MGKKIDAGGTEPILPSGSTKKTSKEDHDNSLNELFSLAKNGDTDKANSLLASIDINLKDKEGRRAVDYAWDNEHYDFVLLLLKKDSVFPDRFDLDEIIGTDEGKDLQQFVEERNRLRYFVKKSNLRSVKEGCSKTSSKYFFNKSNESLLFTALKVKQYDICDFLQSIGAELWNDEKSKLSPEELKFLAEAPVTDSSKLDSSELVNYLTSNSRTKDGQKEFLENIKNYYKKLDRVPEISLVLKVLQCADNLDIVFDFDEKGNVKTIDGTMQKTNFDSNSYKPTELSQNFYEVVNNEIVLATLAQKLTCMAMELVFQNDGKPYKKDNPEQFVETLELIIWKCHKIFREINPASKKFDKSYYTESEMLLDAIQDCVEKDQHKELVARVPYILMQYYNGREWLQNKAFGLLEFFCEQIMLKCRDFLKEQQMISLKIEELNETLCVPIFLETFGLKSVSFIPQILHEDKSQIFIFKTEFTLLGMMKVIQEIFGKYHTAFRHRYLALDFEVLIREKDEIMHALQSEECDVLIIRFKDRNLTNFDPELLQLKPNIKIVLVADHCTAKKITEILKSNHVYQIDDKKISLLSLMKESKEEILSTEVKFQGSELKLYDLIGRDETLHALITGELIENMLEGKTVHIENNLHDIMNMQEAYVDIYKKIEIDTFVNHLKTSKDAFIIKGIEQEKFKNWLNQKSVRKKIVAKSERKIGESIVLVENNFSDDDFKQICQQNPGMKVNFYTVEDVNGLRFTLEQVYNPNYYLKRNFAQAYVNESEINDIVRECPNENFIFSYDDEDYDLEIENFQNALFSDRYDAQNYFDQFKIFKKPVHSFRIKNSKILWKDSNRSIKSIRKYIKYDMKNTIEEVDFVEDVIHKEAIIIADKLGEGKSTTLNALIRNKSIMEKHWIIKINLAYVKCIKGNYDGCPLTYLIEVLQNMKEKLNGKLTENLLKKALDPKGKFPKRVLIVFDGFDEIRDLDIRKKMQKFLINLKLNTNCKIWITTTAQYKQDLEDILSTFALQFIPITELPEKRYKTFIGTPLLQKLTLNRNLNSEQNISRIYESYINMKHEIYFKKFNIPKDEQSEMVTAMINFYQTLAKSMILNDEMPRKNIKKLTAHGVSIGLITLDENAAFTHSSFRDFHFASFIIDVLTEKFTNEADLNEKLKSKLTAIFFKPEFTLIRYFIDSLLQENVGIYKLPGLNEFTATKIVHTACQEDNVQILNLILLNCQITKPSWFPYLIIKLLISKTELVHYLPRLFENNSITIISIIKSILESLNLHLQNGKYRSIKPKEEADLTFFIQEREVEIIISVSEILKDPQKIIYVFDILMLEFRRNKFFNKGNGFKNFINTSNLKNAFPSSKISNELPYFRKETKDKNNQKHFLKCHDNYSDSGKQLVVYNRTSITSRVI